MQSMITNNGWIKIHRKIKEKGYYKKSEYVHLWVHLLLEANHEEKEFMWNGKTIKIKPGQLITGRNEISKKTGIYRSTIERILKYFENEHQIEQQTTNKFRLITILNWEDYQKNEQEIEQQASNKRATSEQQVSTNKNDKNYKNKKNIILQPEVANGINKIFNILYKINPTINFGNLTQRSAAERLVQKVGEDVAIRGAEAAVVIYGKQYAPTITTPKQLEEKFSELVSYYKKNQTTQIQDIGNL